MATSEVPQVEQLYQDGRPMPYVVPWSMEPPDPSALVWRRGGRLAYTNETPQDRVRGALLLRHRSARGRGRAYPARIHTPRHFEVMDRLGCQVCAGDTSREAPRKWKGRRLVLGAEGTRLHEGALTAAPPLHRACALQALAKESGCTHMRGTPVLALVETATPWGVHGLVHDPVTRTPIGEHSVQYSDPRLPATIAFRAIVQLRGCTPITREDLEAA